MCVCEQFVVSKDGICGVICEHSASEGITLLRFLEEFLDYIKLPKEHCRTPTRDVPPKNAPAKCINEHLVNRKIVSLRWDLNDAVARAVQEAAKKINR